MSKAEVPAMTPVAGPASAKAPTKELTKTPAPKPAKPEPKKDEHIEKQFKFYDVNQRSGHGILETNMLRKEEDKPLPDYKIKEILSYQDSVGEKA
jgi:hypothetical protein